MHRHRPSPVRLSPASRTTCPQSDTVAIPLIPAALCSGTQGRLSRPGAGLGRRRHDENVANGRPELRAQDVAHHALDGTLHGGESIERGTLVERRTPRGVEVRCEAGKDSPIARSMVTASARRYRSRTSGSDPWAARGVACRGRHAPPSRPRAADRCSTARASPAEDSTARGSQMCAPSVAAVAVWRVRWRGARP